MLQSEYFSEHPRGVNPVQLNDVVFSLHATAACIVTVLQCFIYEVSLFVFLTVFAFSQMKLLKLGIGNDKDNKSLCIRMLKSQI